MVRGRFTANPSIHMHVLSALQVLYNNVLDSMWLLAPWVVWTALLTTIYVLSLIWTMSMESDLQVWTGLNPPLCPPLDPRSSLRPIPTPSHGNPLLTGLEIPFP